MQQRGESPSRRNEGVEQVEPPVQRIRGDAAEPEGCRVPGRHHQRHSIIGDLRAGEPVGVSAVAIGVQRRALAGENFNQLPRVPAGADQQHAAVPGFDAATRTSPSSSWVITASIP